MATAGALPWLPASAATLISSYARFDCWPSAAAAAAEQQMPLAADRTCQTHRDTDVSVLQWWHGSADMNINHLMPTEQTLTEEIDHGLSAQDAQRRDSSIADLLCKKASPCVDLL